MRFFDFFKRKPKEETPVAVPPSLLSSSVSTSDPPPPSLKAGVSSCPHSRPYVILDVETTGLNPNSDAIIQLSAIKYDTQGTPTDFYNTYLNPDRHIPIAASQINGITDEMVVDAPHARQIQDQFLSFIGDHLILGYNVVFDLRFLNQTFENRFNGRQYVDVLTIARALLCRPNYKLETVASSLGFNPKAAFHDSFVDCEAVAAILNYTGDVLSNWVKKFKDHEASSQLAEKPRLSDEGFEYWARGDAARKCGAYEMALQLFHQAKEAGYTCPAIYESYAMTYRKLKDYKAEILVLEEAINYFDGYIADSFGTRRARAQALLDAQQQKDDELQQKTLARAKKSEERRQKEEQAKLKPKQPRSQSVMQCSDDGAIIKIHSSVKSAAQEVEVTPKCIRDAASGKQKHAGGFCWKYITSDGE